MRCSVAMLVLLLTVGNPLRAQDERVSRSCTVTRIDESFYQAVLDEAFRPTDWQTSLVSISIADATAERRLVLREIGGKFEIMEGQPEENIYDLLGRRARTCELGPNADHAATAIRVKWRRVSVPPSEFLRLHNQLVLILSKDIARLTAKNEKSFGRSAYVNIHTGQRIITYDTKAEHFQIRIDEGPDRMKSITEWIQSVRTLYQSSGSQ